MNYAVNISSEAAADLRAIFEYIAFKLHSVQNASSQLARLEEEIYSLNQLPERSRRYDEEPWHSCGLRLMPVDNYCVFYIPNRESRTVNIVRVIYGGRDIASELEKYTAED